MERELNDEAARAERRARREARRERQRELNIVRAADMHAARLAFDREWRRGLHVPAPGSLSGLRAAPGGQRIHVGCSGWFYWHWRDCFYPPGAPSSGWFQHYSAKFKTVELNAPFYSWPAVATVKTWVKQAARRREFTYAIKVCELITHVRRFVGTRTLVRDFGLIADLLGSRFGCFLFQLPPSFHYTPAALRRVVASLDLSRRNVVEFRHRSWWNENVYRAFRDANITFCSCSGPRLPDELVRTSDDVYVRFHGTKQWYRHDYSKAELAVWAERIQSSGAKRVWAYFNNDRNCYAIKNARELVRQLNSLIN